MTDLIGGIGVFCPNEQYGSFYLQGVVEFARDDDILPSICHGD
jgi:hypothetical protein